MVRAWFGQAVRAWFGHGSGKGWFGHGSGMVRAWFGHGSGKGCGSGMVRAWFGQGGSGMVRAWFGGPLFQVFVDQTNKDKKSRAVYKKSEFIAKTTENASRIQRPAEFSPIS